MNGRKRRITRDSAPTYPPIGPTATPSCVALLLSLFLLGSCLVTPLRAAPANARKRSTRSAVSAKLIRYAERLLDQFDRNGDGRLDQSEWSEMLLDRYDKNWDGRLGPDEWDETRIREYDGDKDGFLEPPEWARIWIGQKLPRSDGGAGVEELVRAIAALGGGKPIVLRQSHLGETTKPLPLLSPATAGGARPPRPEKPEQAPKVGSPGEKPPSGSPPRSPPRSPPGRKGRSTKFYLPRSQLPRGLPSWFLPRDADGDGQLTMAEYAPKPTAAQLAEFTRYDRNGDGVLTAEECARGPRPRPEKPAEQTDVAEEETAEEPGEDTGEKTAEKAAEKPGEEAAEDTAEKAGDQAEKPAEKEAEESAAARAAALRKRRLEQRARKKNLLKESSTKSASKGGGQARRDSTSATKRSPSSEEGAAQQ